MATTLCCFRAPSACGKIRYLDTTTRRWHLVDWHVLHSCFLAQWRSASIVELWGSNVINVDAFIIYDAISGSRHGSPSNSPWRVYSRLAATFLEDRESVLDRPDPELPLTTRRCPPRKWPRCGRRESLAAALAKYDIQNICKGTIKAARWARELMHAR